MIASITLVAILGIYRVGGIVAVWDRAVEGGRIFTPMYVFFPFRLINFSEFHNIVFFSPQFVQHISFHLFLIKIHSVCFLQHVIRSQNESNTVEFNFFSIHCMD